MPRKRVLLPVLGLVVLAVVVTTLVATGRLEDRSAVSSAYSAHPVGCKALYLVLEELGLPVSRFRRRFTMLDDHSGVLVVVNPHVMPFSRREIATLKQWIKRGNRLVLFQGLETQMGLGDDEKPSRETKWASAKARVLAEPSKYFGLSLRRISDSIGPSVPVSLPDAPGVRRISVSGEVRWREPSGRWTRLVQDTHGPILIRRTLDRGSVIAVSDPRLASNRGLSREDNLKLVLALVIGEKKPAEILFDEYHHGNVQSDSFTGFVESSVFSWILVQTLLGLGLFFYSSRAQQAGRFQSLREPVGRSSMEHVESMATIFAMSKAGSAALEALVNRFLRQFSRTTGVRMKAAGGEHPHQALLTLPGGSKELNRLLQECGQEIRSGHSTGKAVILARRLAEERARLERNRSAYKKFRPRK